MNMFLSGKKAVVTGASKGIGFEVAKALSLAGADVVLCGRDEQRLNQAAGEIRRLASERKVAAIPTDVSKSDQVHALFELADKELGGLDILINNAGAGVFRATAQLSIDEWDRTIATNLSGAFYCSREALQRFTPDRGGWIVNLSSLAGRNPFAGGAAYNASKFGLNGFTEAMMLDHRNEKVRVSYIMPGSVDTEFSGHAPTKKSEWMIAPEDIAEIVLDILRKPERTLISRVEVRPSRPRKD